MKRSRRVVLMLMGTAALSSVSSMALARRGGNSCGPQHEKHKRHGPGALSSRHCRATFGGFGTTTHRFHFHGGGG